MQATNSKAKFTPGVLLATPGASEAFEKNGQTPLEFLRRHISGDWGDLCEEDRQANDHALIDGSRLLSAYKLKDQTKVWAITEAVGDNGRREATTFCSPRNTDRTATLIRRKEPHHPKRIDGSVPELLRVFPVRNDMDRRVRLHVRPTLSELQWRDRAVPFR